MSATNAAPASSSAVRAEKQPRYRLQLGLALTTLVLIAVLATALLVHVSWMLTASRNIESVVGSLNAQTANAVRNELETTFRASEGAAEIVRSILFQGAVKAEDEVKREFVFLSVLRSLPAVSWIGFGFPDGRFFGSHALDDGKIEMVEIGDRLSSGNRYLRRDRYQPIPGDIFFEERTKGETAYVSLGAKWYRNALASKSKVWTMVDILPNGFEPAAVVSTRLEQYKRLQGVLMVSLNLKRLSNFLASLDVGRTGAAVIIGDSGTVIASSIPNMKSLSPNESAGSALVGALRQAAQQRVRSDGTVRSDDRRIFYATAIPLEFNGWKLLTAVPRAAFTAEIDRNTRWLLAGVTLMALLGAATAALFANLFFARPIQKIAGELRHVESFSLGMVRYIPTALRELDELSAALKRMAGSLTAFGLYVPADIVRTLIRQGVDPKPGGELREITVMFADLPGFTQLTETYGAGVAPFLTDFLTLATQAIHREGGTVDKFIGDCIMALWNAPKAESDHALRACRAAIAIRDAMRDLARPDGRHGAPAVRIGINSGSALVGNIGSLERLSYTAIGDVVNVASRLETLGKTHDAEVIIGETTRKQCEGSILVRALGATAVRGREKSLHIYELLDVFAGSDASAVEKTMPAV